MFEGLVVCEDPQPARRNTGRKKGAVRHVGLKGILFFFDISIQALSDNVPALASMLA
jgi:hypothetical protein